MLSLEEKGSFKLHSLDVHAADGEPLESLQGVQSPQGSSQMEAIRQLLADAQAAGQSHILKDFCPSKKMDCQAA